MGHLLDSILHTVTLSTGPTSSQYKTTKLLKLDAIGLFPTHCDFTKNYSDPFYGPNYLLQHIWIQAVLIIGVSQAFSLILTKWVMFINFLKLPIVFISWQLASASCLPHIRIEKIQNTFLIAGCLQKQN